jgi:hypothetical protein
VTSTRVSGRRGGRPVLALLAVLALAVGACNGNDGGERAADEGAGEGEANVVGVGDTYGATIRRASLLTDVSVLSSDAMQGRDNATVGSTRAQNYLIGQLKTFAIGLDSSRPGDDSFKQPFTAGTNILALIPGSELANEYVIVGAHYDHLGSSCRTADPADTICNGASDNAANVAAVLSLGREVAKHGPPRRSVILALWDREEDGLLGSRFYVQQPLVPLGQTVAYVNLDGRGRNLLPSLRRMTFAIGAETGSKRLTSMVADAIGAGPLDAQQVSATFGQGRSDYVNFIGAGIPTVFFTDATGPCYHTAQDDIDVVDFWKLGFQVRADTRLVADLVATDDPPDFVPSTTLATFEDALTVQHFVTTAIDDIGRFSEAEQQQLLDFRAKLDAVVAAGATEFGNDDVLTVLIGTVATVNALTTGGCDGFLDHN